MEIVHDRPPNYEDIVKIFPQASRASVMFSFGPKLYVPNGKTVPKELIAHELIHSGRQGVEEDSILLWWENYLKDKDFRYHEELLAHCAEYQAHIQGGANRAMKRRALKVIAKRLSSPLYGSVTTFDKAKEIIKARV